MTGRTLARRFLSASPHPLLASMHLDLTDTTVVVTGVLGRLGRVLSQRLLSYGATVAGVDARLADRFVDSDRLHLFEADLADEAAVAEVFGTLAERLGPLDACIHTVGMWAGAPFEATTLEDWETMLRVNLTSTFLCFREAVRQLRSAGKGGRLVAIAAKQGAEGGVAEQAAYSASKAGVVRLVEAVAAEYAGDGITAAAVAPSMILFGGEDAATQGVSAERVADLCAYLASEAGTAHTGTVVRAYGSLL